MDTMIEARASALDVPKLSAGIAWVKPSAKVPKISVSTSNLCVTSSVLPETFDPASCAMLVYAVWNADAFTKPLAL